MEIATIEPKMFNAGLTVSWERTFSNYLYADGFTTAVYTINGIGGSKTITGTYADGVWTFTLTAAENTLAAGKYTLFGYVQKGSGASTEKYEVYKGSLEIFASLTTATATEQRTALLQQLDMINTAITNYATEPVEEMTISTTNGSRHYRRPSLIDLYKFRALTQKLIRNEIKKENVRNGRPAGGSTLARLVNA